MRKLAALLHIAILTLLQVGCSALNLDKDSNCLNEKSACFRTDTTRPQLVQTVVPAPGVVVSALAEVTLLFSEELNNPQPSDFTYSEAGLSVTAVTQIDKYTYRLTNNRNPTQGGPLTLNFPNLRDYNGNLIQNGSITYTININIPVTTQADRNGVSTGGFPSITVNWYYQYVPVVAGNTVYSVRLTTGAEDCTAGTAITPTTATPAINTAVATYDNSTPATIAATTHSFSVDTAVIVASGAQKILVCVENANNNKRGLGVVPIVRDDSAPSALSVNPPGGNFVSARELTFSCGDNPLRIAYAFASNAASTVDPLASAVADPDFNTTTGAVTSGTEYNPNNKPVTPYNGNTTRTIYKYRCIDQAGNISAVFTSGVFRINTSYPVVNLASLTKTGANPTVNITGVSSGGGAYNSATLTWSSNQIGQAWEIRSGATDCGAGGTVVAASPPVTPAPAGTLVTTTILPTSPGIAVGTNSLRLCVSNGTDWGEATFTLLRDDTPPLLADVRTSIPAGTYGTAQNAVFSCSDNEDRVIYTESNSTPTGTPADPLDPQLDADGRVTFGSIASGPVAITSDTTQLVGKKTRIKWRCIDKAGNISPVQDATWLIDTLLPTITVQNQDRTAISTLAGAYNAVQLTWVADRTGATYQIYRGGTNCNGTAVTGTNTSGVPPAAGVPVVSTIPASAFPGNGVYTLQICMTNYAGGTGFTSRTIRVDSSPPTILVNTLQITQVNPTTFSLQMGAAFDNHTIAGYRISRSTSTSACGAATVYTVATNPATVVMPDLTPYYLRVTPFDEAGNVPNSGTLCYTEVVTRPSISIAVSGLDTANSKTFTLSDGVASQVISNNTVGTSWTTSLAAGSQYGFSITQQPAGQLCAITNQQSGTLNSNVTINIQCVNGHLAGGAMVSNAPVPLQYFLYRGQSTAVAGGFTFGHGIVHLDGRIYTTEYDTHRVRQVDTLTFAVTTIAGTGAGGSADGNGVSAQFNRPNAITTDGVNLYVTQLSSPAIRKIALTAGDPVTTIAGGGVSGTPCPGVSQPTCLDGPAFDARFEQINGLVYHNGFLYLADYSHNRIRRLNLASGIVETIAGTGASGANNGVGSVATFTNPGGLTAIGDDLYVSDHTGHRIRKVSLVAPYHVTTLAGSGTVGKADGPLATATFNSPNHLTSDGQSLFLTETGGGVVRKIDLARGVVSTIAGQGTAVDSVGTGISAQFHGPVGITHDGRRLYVMTHNAGGTLYRLTDSGLAGYWPLNGQTTDYNSLLVSQNNLTPGGSPVAAAGRFTEDNGAYRFTGAQNLSSASAPTTAACNVTIAIWAKANGTNASGSNIFTVGNSGSNGYSLFMNSSGYANLVLGGSYADGNQSSVPIYTGIGSTWHHLAATCTNSDRWTLYVDGRPVNRFQVTAIAPSANTVIGGAGTQFFNGLLADARAYSRALNEAEINELAQSARETEAGPSLNKAATGLLSHYTFTNAAAGTAVFDSGALQLLMNPLSAPAVLTTLDKDGDTSGAYAFTGAQAYRTASSAGLPLARAPRTMCAWVQPFNYPAAANNKQFVRYGTGAQGNFGIFMYNPGTTQRVGIVTVTNDYVDPQYALPLYTWSHFCATFDGNNASVYVNGQQLGTVNGYAISTLAAELYVGGDGTAIDDVRLYDNALSAAQIRQIATQVPTGLVARYELNNDDGATSADEWQDLSGWGNPITGQSASAPVGISDRFARTGRAVNLQRSSGQYLSVSDAAILTPPRDITVAAWINPTELPVTAGSIYTIAAKMDTGGNGFSVQLWRDSSGDQRLYFWNGGSAGEGYSVPYMVPAGVFSHVAFVRSGTGTVFYVNGALIASQVSNSTGRNASSNPLLIGARNDNIAAHAFNGAIDDVRIYNRALSANEVRALVTQSNKAIKVLGSAVTGTLEGGSGLLGGDSLCGAGFKALIADDTTRRACTTPNCMTGITEHLDWVLRPNITYLRDTTRVAVFTANWNGIHDFTGANFYAPISTTADWIWTGMSGDWQQDGSNCGNWSTTVGNGAIGQTTAIGSGALQSAVSSCGSSFRIICVEQ
ncbi:MAG: LamG-like jellyroll fold domain-containing protein [Spirochaetota bacterium]